MCLPALIRSICNKCTLEASSVSRPTSRHCGPVLKAAVDSRQWTVNKAMKGETKAQCLSQLSMGPCSESPALFPGSRLGGNVCGHELRYASALCKVQATNRWTVTASATVCWILLAKDVHKSKRRLDCPSSVSHVEGVMLFAYPSPCVAQPSFLLVQVSSDTSTAAPRICSSANAIQLERDAGP